jgi:hypothetical protein
MEGLSLTNIITIGVLYLGQFIGFFIYVKIEIAKLNFRYQKMEEDRKDKWVEQKEKWACHDEKQDKSDAYFTDILRGQEEIKGDIKTMKETLKWVQKKPK